MQSILAISALHIAHVDASNREVYWRRAAAHEDRTLNLVQSEMASPNPGNADALFAYCILTVYYAFGAPSHSSIQDGQRPLQGPLQCLNLLRSIRSIVPSVRHWVESGSLKPLLDMHPGNIQSSPTFSDPLVTAHFSKLLVFSSTTSTSGPAELEDMENFAAAASSLRGSFLKVESMAEGEAITHVIWHWAVRLPPAFVDRLGDHEVVPLVLLAHWCVLLVQVRRHWWIEGWVERTMEEVMRCLPDEHRHWLDWPLDTIRKLEAGGKVVQGNGPSRLVDPLIN